MKNYEKLINIEYKINSCIGKINKKIELLNNHQENNEFFKDIKNKIIDLRKNFQLLKKEKLIIIKHFENLQIQILNFIDILPNNENTIKKENSNSNIISNSNIDNYLQDKQIHEQIDKNEFLNFKRKRNSVSLINDNQRNSLNNNNQEDLLSNYDINSFKCETHKVDKLSKFFNFL